MTTCCGSFLRGAARPVRTTSDGPLPPQQALKLLKQGNSRYASGKMLGSCTSEN
eukprot:CAMPEP_0181439894 /NCGR_PEP_ID=MMETSP1110-20121109/22674_1 /TAXON_ID=174948 /ORGANISM="Symbiodinium sp., Strain CCMP421" /LENGTH=53 /DNA_ID=CAMNT_0023563655 /DNA_START=58 /DNA_END=216 /DNA_ORIENTATION=+